MTEKCPAKVHFVLVGEYMLFQNLRLWCCHLLTARWYMSSGSSLSATYMKIAYISGSALSAKLIMSFKSASIIPCMHPR